MADHVRDATHAWFRSVPRRTVFRRLETRRGDWEGSGSVSVTDIHLVFDGARARTTSRRTIRAVERYEALVWIQRRRAHDWLVRCRTDPEAKALVAALRQPAEAS